MIINRRSQHALKIILMIFLALGMCFFVKALPSPHSIRGYVVEADGDTQAFSGTYFTVNDSDTGYAVSGYTGRGPSNPGKYATVINGSDGDTITIEARSDTHRGSTTLSLQGSMYNVIVTLNETLPVEIVESTTFVESSNIGPGGGMIQPKQMTYVMPITNIKEHIPKVIEIEERDTDVSSITITVKRGIPDSRLHVSVLPDKPLAIKNYPKSGKVYTYLRIEKDFDSAVIENVTIKFRVKNKWISEQNKKARDIVLMRYNGIQWEELETRIANIEQSYIYYSATGRNFSYFAVTFNEAERPKIDKNVETTSKVIQSPYHIHGILYTKDGRTTVANGTEYVFWNLNRSISVKGETGGGVMRGYYSVLIDGVVDDRIMVQVGNWSEIYELKGDMVRNFITDIEPVVERPSESSEILFVLGIILGLVIVCASIFLVWRWKRGY